MQCFLPFRYLKEVENKTYLSPPSSVFKPSSRGAGGPRHLQQQQQQQAQQQQQQQV